MLLSDANMRCMHQLLSMSIALMIDLSSCLATISWQDSLYPKVMIFHTTVEETRRLYMWARYEFHW